ncbi:MAG: TM2 domain-containing protein [Cytophagaceae bacterium]
MDAQKVDMYLMTNGKYFESNQIPFLREKLLQMDDAKFLQLQSLNLKDPTISIVLSIMAGTLGVDRFVIGDIGLGVGKLLTCGGFYVWAIVDWFLIMGRTREKNLQLLLSII